MPEHILTANDLMTGEVVFFDNEGQWTRNYHDALVVNNEDGRHQLEVAGSEAEKANHVTGAVLVETDETGPVHIREYIRVGGPTIRDDLKKGLLPDYRIRD